MAEVLVGLVSLVLLVAGRGRLFGRQYWLLAGAVPIARCEWAVARRTMRVVKGGDLKPIVAGKVSVSRKDVMRSITL